MNTKKMTFTSYSRAKYSQSHCFRPDTAQQLLSELPSSDQGSLLARGSGLSYSDACLNQDGLIIDTSRLNHFISFDEQTAVAVCQSGVTLADLFSLNPEFIPPVIPGTLHATLAGALAQDVHGKNNHQIGTFGHHILWFELLINHQLIQCSPEKNSDLFYATIAGLGLTGIMTKIALKLKKASRFVKVENKNFFSNPELTAAMSSDGLNYDYQAAWIDLLHSKTRSILMLATQSPAFSYQPYPSHTIKKLPISLIKRWNIKCFNSLYFHGKEKRQQLALEQFNNPLDQIHHWNYLYGPKGLIQFQAVFDKDLANDLLSALLEIIQMNKATPTLAVLKLLTQSGQGLLSFCKPGFTVAIDFIHNAQARKAIEMMNELIVAHQGRIYLAKDLLLTPKQFQAMYEHYEDFLQVLKKYHCSMNSDLAQRLRITP